RAGLWRSSQPSPNQIAFLARRGIRTIVNLRGERDCGSYRLEVAACRRHGVDLVNFAKLRSRAAPSREGVLALGPLFGTIALPALFHCKTGADRAGLVAALFLVLHEGQTVETAMSQLNIRYGHMKRARTGILDAFFEAYLAYNAVTPIPFRTWVETVYDE